METSFIWIADLWTWRRWSAVARLKKIVWSRVLASDSWTADSGQWAHYAEITTYKIMRRIDAVTRWCRSSLFLFDSRAQMRWMILGPVVFLALSLQSTGSNHIRVLSFVPLVTQKRRTKFNHFCRSSQRIYIFTKTEDEVSRLENRKWNTKKWSFRIPPFNCNVHNSKRCWLWILNGKNFRKTEWR